MMPTARTLAHRLLMASVCLAAFYPLQTRAEIKVGVTSAVNPEAIEKLDSGETKMLYIGAEAFSNEHVTTGHSGRVQLLFRDGSTLSVGPDAELTIDKFVFDPQTGQGDMAVSAATGLLRFVGGKISKTSEVAVTTPTATIGIRGGVAVVDTKPGGDTDAQFVFGDRMKVSAQGEIRVLEEPGYGVSVQRGQAPSAPRFLTVADTLAVINQFRTRSADANSSKQIDPGLEKHDVASATGSSQGPGVMGLGFGDTTPISENVANAADQAVTLSADDFFTAGSSSRATHGRFIAEPAYSYFDPVTLMTTRDYGCDFTFADDFSTIGQGSIQITLSEGSFSAPYQPGAGFVQFDDNSASVFFGSVTGTSYVSEDEHFYIFYGTQNDYNGEKFALFGGDETVSFPTGGFAAHSLTEAFGPLPFADRNVVNASAEDDGVTVSQLYSAYAPVLDAAGRANSDVRPVHFQASLGIIGDGPGQRSFLIGETGEYQLDTSGSVAAVGFVNGFYRDDGNSPLIRIGSHLASASTDTGNAIYGDNADYMVLISEGRTGNPSTDPSVFSTAAYTEPHDTLVRTPYTFVTVATPEDASGIGNQRTSQTLSGYSASIVEMQDGSALPVVTTANALTLSTSAENNRLSAQFNFKDSSGRLFGLNFGSTSGLSQGDSAFIDDYLFAARESSTVASTVAGAPAQGSKLIMVSSSAVPLNGTSIQPCDCQYLSWGWWAGEVIDSNGNVLRFPVSTWVAGVLPTLAEIPTTGTASYDGHAIGNVVDANGARYIAGGQFNLSWNFASKSGTSTISNFDGLTFAGATSSTNGRDLTGSLAGSGVTGSLKGSFFKGGGDPVAAVGGAFSVTGAGGYAAVGTVAGQR